MVKIFQYFESPGYAILLNSFYFSIFASFALVYVPKCAELPDITNFHSSLAFSSSKIARYFKSPYYPILLNSFYFSLFALRLFTSIFTKKKEITIDVLAKENQLVYGEHLKIIKKN